MGEVVLWLCSIGPGLLAVTLGGCPESIGDRLVLAVKMSVVMIIGGAFLLHDGKPMSSDGKCLMALIAGSWIAWNVGFVALCPNIMAPQPWWQNLFWI